MNKLKSILKKYRLTLIGLTAGAIGGYLYWLYVGCINGTCTITSSPFYSSLWGAAIGGLLLSGFQKETKKKKR